MSWTGPRPRLPIHGASLASWCKRKPWRARVYLGGRQRSLGYFSTREEARAAHTAAVKAHLGEQFLKGLTADEGRQPSLALPYRAPPDPAPPHHTVPDPALPGRTLPGHTTPEMASISQISGGCHE
jgi:hypothetical protein